MLKHAVICLGLIIVASVLYGQEAIRQYPAVKRVLDDAARAVRKNRLDFDKANQKPLAEARSELQSMSAKAIKEGRTDEATVILGQVKSLEADVMKMEDAPLPARGAKGLLDRMAGTWTHPSKPNRVFVIEANGDFVEAFQQAKVSRGRIVLVTEDWGEVRMDNGFKIQLGMVGENAIASKWWDPAGKKSRIT